LWGGGWGKPVSILNGGGTEHSPKRRGKPLHSQEELVALGGAQKEKRVRFLSERREKKKATYY